MQQPHAQPPAQATTYAGSVPILPGGAAVPVPTSPSHHHRARLASKGDIRTPPHHAEGVPASPSGWHSPMPSPTTQSRVPAHYAQGQAPGYPQAPQGVGMHLQAGSDTLKGAKPNMPDWINQDVSIVMPLEGNRILGAVFDGHGRDGHTCSRLACTTLMENAKTVFTPGCDLTEAFTNIFSQIHDKLAAQGWEVAGMSGCTGTLGMVDPMASVCHVANVGDSTALVANGRGITFTSTDHKIEPHDEERINTCGGEVRVCEQSGARRVFSKGAMTPGLMLARSLGDLEANSCGVLADPEIRLNIPYQIGTVLILASDGLWDVLPKDGIARTAIGGEPKQCAQTMVRDARTLWSKNPHIDDITCVIIKAGQRTPMPQPGAGMSPHVSPRIAHQAPQPLGFASPLASPSYSGTAVTAVAAPAVTAVAPAVTAVGAAQPIGSFRNLNVGA